MTAVMDRLRTALAQAVRKAARAERDACVAIAEATETRRTELGPEGATYGGYAPFAVHGLQGQRIAAAIRARPEVDEDGLAGIEGIRLLVEEASRSAASAETGAGGGASRPSMPGRPGPDPVVTVAKALCGAAGHDPDGMTPHEAGDRRWPDDDVFDCFGTDGVRRSTPRHFAWREHENAAHAVVRALRDEGSIMTASTDAARLVRHLRQAVTGDGSLAYPAGKKALLSQAADMIEALQATPGLAAGSAVPEVTDDMNRTARGIYGPRDPGDGEVDRERMDRALKAVFAMLPPRSAGPAKSAASDDAMVPRSLLDAARATNGRLVEEIDSYRTLRRRLRRVERRLEEGVDVPGSTAAGILSDLRSKGWMVAVHNDYRLDGETMTFWLFTHPGGGWLKGEGATDGEALAEVADALARRRGAADPTGALVGGPAGPAAVTDGMVDAAAEVMWTDRDARMGGPWSHRGPDEVVVIQTRATARAAIEAALAVASESPDGSSGPGGETEAPDDAQAHVAPASVEDGRVEDLIADFEHGLSNPVELSGRRGAGAFAFPESDDGLSPSDPGEAVDGVSGGYAADDASSNRGDRITHG